MKYIGLDKSAEREYRPEETHRRLLEAGLTLFGKAGLDAVSTRQLAKAARVTLNAIQYHFGGKERVYLAVADYLVQTTGAQIRAAAQMSLKGVDGISSNQAATQTGELLCATVRVILSAPDAASRGGFILREQLQPTAAFEILFQGFVKVLHEALTVLTARATGTKSADPRTVITAHSLLGQALGFGMARETLARRLGRARLTAADSNLICRVVAQVSSAALTGLRKETL